MKTLVILAGILFCWIAPSPLLAYAHWEGYCQQGGQKVVTSSVSSTTSVQQSYPLATLTVYITGTGSPGAKATLYSDNNATPLGNPLTCSSKGYFSFYAVTGTLDLTFSGAGISAPFTWGAVQQQEPLTVQGAVCDGSTDDTAAFQAAASSGKSFYVPQTTTYCKISQTISLTAAGQSIYGFGRLSRIVQTGINANSTVFYAPNLGYNEFHDIYITPGTTTSATADGWAVKVFQSNFVKIDHVEVSGHRRGAFILQDSSYGEVTNNSIHDSVVLNTNPTVDTSSTSGNDIYIYGNGLQHIIKGNSIHNGAGFGIGVQTTTNPADVSNGHIIDANTIDGEGLYGIYTYRGDPSAKVWHVIVSNNNVMNISGYITSPGGAHDFGSCIYVASAEYETIIGNKATNCNIYPTPTLVNGAGCVNVTGAAAVKVADNTCYNPGSYSFDDIIAIAPSITGGISEWTNNTSFSSSGAQGFKIGDIPSLKVDGMHLYRSVAGQTAIDDSQTAVDQSDYRSYNNVTTSGYAAGIVQSASVGTIKKSTVSNSYFSGNTGYAALLIATTSEIKDNIIYQGTGGIGLGFSSAVATGTIRGNVIRGGAQCIGNDSGAIFLINQNDVGNPGDSGVCTTTYPLGFGISFGMAGATPSVAGQAGEFRITDSVTKTNFLHGVPGQILILHAAASVTIQNNGTIALAGSHDFAMISGDVVVLDFITSSWQEIARAQTTPGIYGTVVIRNAAGSGTCGIVFVNGQAVSTTC